MAKDRRGNPLRVGDKVIVEFVVTQVVEGHEVDLDLMRVHGKPGRNPYHTNAGSVEKVCERSEGMPVFDNMREARDWMRDHPRIPAISAVDAGRDKRMVPDVVPASEYEEAIRRQEKYGL